MCGGGKSSSSQAPAAKPAPTPFGNDDPNNVQRKVAATSGTLGQSQPASSSFGSDLAFGTEGETRPNPLPKMTPGTPGRKTSGINTSSWNGGL